MNFHSYFRLLALVMIATSSTIAQTSLGLPDEVGQLTTITESEAEQHLIEHKPPAYPPLAKAARIEGDVRLMLQVSTNGAVVRVIPLSGHPLLIPAATEAAKQYRYRPFEVSGTPVDVLVDAVVSFSLYVPTQPVPFPEITNIESVVMEYDDGWVQVRVSGNGTVEYKGTRFVVVEGKHERHIEPAEVQALIETFRKADFFSLNDNYSVSASDVGSQSTGIHIGTVQKTITSNIQIPTTLKSVQDAILKYSHSEQWITGNGDTVSSLLAETQSPTAKKQALSEVLPRAALYGDTALVRGVLANAVDLEHHGPYDATALMLAADRGLPDMVAALLKAGAKPTAKDGEGRGAVIFGAGSGNADVLQLLLKAGLKGNEKDKYGDTALMAAAASGNPECVRLLLNSGAKVNARNKRRQTALLSGATGDSGFSVDDSGRGIVEVPDELIHRDLLVRMLVAAGANMNARDWDGETALFSLEDDAVMELINHHINLELRDKYGQTALIETVSGSIAGLLIKAGADINAQDNKGKTALIMAAENNEIEKLKVLVLARGIDLVHRDKKDETALMKAKAKHLEDSVRILLAAGATE
jgi:TonB family protein